MKIINPYRFGSTFSPSDISSLSVWFDASDSSTLYTDTGMTTNVSSDGDAVAAWADKSGSGIHVTQATPAIRPLYKTAIQNGHSAVLGDGDQQLSKTSFDSADAFGGTAGYIAAVVRADSVHTISRLFWTAGTDGTNYVGLQDFNNVMYWDFPNTSTGRISGTTPAGFDDTTVIWEAYRDGANMGMLVDGSSVASRTNASGTLSFTGGTFGLMYHTTATRSWTGYVFELVFCSAYPSAGDRSDLYSYFALKWGL